MNGATAVKPRAVLARAVLAVAIRLCETVVDAIWQKVGKVEGREL
jgi:hypothetical protein